MVGYDTKFAPRDAEKCYAIVVPVEIWTAKKKTAMISESSPSRDLDFLLGEEPRN